MKYEVVLCACAIITASVKCVCVCKMALNLSIEAKRLTGKACLGHPF